MSLGPNDDRYSAGPFCRVFFLYGKHGLRTYAYRSRTMETPKTQIEVISSTWEGGPRFAQVFVDTEFLR